jgi:hypothetical protein
MKKYTIDLGDDEFVAVPEKIRYQIIQDNIMRSYQWTIGIGMFMIGFLVGLLAK